MGMTNHFHHVFIGTPPLGNFTLEDSEEVWRKCGDALEKSWKTKPARRQASITASQSSILSTTSNTM